MLETKKDVGLITGFRDIRETTERLCLPLKTEDYGAQPMVDVSPPKWHLAHSTWFFENFILIKYKKDYKVFHPTYGYLFNSYYESIGERVSRAKRGDMTRPTVEEVYAYRSYVDRQMLDLLESPEQIPEDILLLGLNHEQQHQELLLTDLKYTLAQNPLYPAYNGYTDTSREETEFLQGDYLEVEEGIYQIGSDSSSFCFDNERGLHKVYLHGFRFMDRLITNSEYLEFMEDGGYKNFRHWLLEGWEWVKANHINAPLYWQKIEGDWYSYTLSGLKKVSLNAPVTHISYFEADAYASWKGKRLLTEAEWEVAARQYAGELNPLANFLEGGFYEPKPAGYNNQLFGDTWEWTSSAYLPYPFYQKSSGAVGEYNGKFMINQMVLRGGSCVTPEDHIRHSYRNFFHPDKRWQFTGIRLAESL